MLLDASKMGKKVKDGKNQRTVLMPNEIKQIEDTFIDQKVVDDFSVQISYEDIQNKNYSLSAGQYFEIKIEYVELTEEEFNQKIAGYTSDLQKYFDEEKSIEKEILKGLEELKYE